MTRWVVRATLEVLKSLMATKPHSRPAVKPCVSEDSLIEGMVFLQMIVNKESGKKISDLDAQELTRLVFQWVSDMGIDILESPGEWPTQ